MKKLIYIACFLLVVCPVLANPFFPLMSGITPVEEEEEGPDVWYGPTVSGLTYESSAVLGEKITITQGGSLTKISIWVEDKGAADIKLALYNSTGSALLSSGGTLSNASIVNEAWNDITLGTPIAVSSSQVVSVCGRMSAEIQVRKDDATTDDGFWSSVAYATFPPSTLSMEDSDAHHGFRVYVD